MLASYKIVAGRGYQLFNDARIGEMTVTHKILVGATCIAND